MDLCKLLCISRGEEIRTPDLLLPKQERYRCATPRSLGRLSPPRAQVVGFSDLTATGSSGVRGEVADHPQEALDVGGLDVADHAGAHHATGLGQAELIDGLEGV